MKAILINGSPRKGNTRSALDALERGLANINGLEFKEISAAKVHILPCIACKACKKVGRCIFDDDTNQIEEDIVSADILIFASPVYWWGLPAQIKLIIDKFYSQADRLALSEKQVGIITVGQLSVSNVQYSLIEKQIECISEYLGWKMVFSKAYSAYDLDDLADDPMAIAEIEDLWEKLAH